MWKHQPEDGWWDKAHRLRELKNTQWQESKKGFPISLYTDNAIRKTWRHKSPCSFPWQWWKLCQLMLGWRSWIMPHDSHLLSRGHLFYMLLQWLRPNFNETSILRSPSLREVRHWSVFTSILVKYQGNFRGIASFDIWVKPGWITQRIKTEPGLQIQHQSPLPSMVFGVANSGCVSDGSFMCFAGQWADLLWK